MSADAVMADLDRHEREIDAQEQAWERREAKIDALAAKIGSEVLDATNIKRRAQFYQWAADNNHGPHREVFCCVLGVMLAKGCWDSIKLELIAERMRNEIAKFARSQADDEVRHED